MKQGNEQQGAARHSAQEYAANNANSFMNRINRTLALLQAGGTVTPEDFNRLEFDSNQLMIEADASGDAELIAKAKTTAEEALRAVAKFDEETAS